MIAIEIAFLTGHFNATPWGRHVNEGVAEWPPSPWRLLRALIAVAKRTSPSLSDSALRAILQPLVTPPSFLLPPATVAHTRHYMPWGKKGPTDRTLIFDTFVAVCADTPVLFVWPETDLSPDDRVTLDSILRNLNVFGRAESWCEARLLGESESAVSSSVLNCRPLDHSVIREGVEPVRVLCADPATAFENQQTPKASVGGSRRKAATDSARPYYNPDWHLCLETLDLHKERWSQVPGTQWVTYDRSADCFRLQAHLSSAVSIQQPRPTIARYAIDERVPPLVRSTLTVAEQFRRAVMSSYRRVREGELGPADAGSRLVSEVLAGKDAEGRPLTDHRHAYYLPTDDDGDGRIDHITVFAQRGFDNIEVKALDRLRSLYLGPGESVRLLLVGLGVPKDLNAALFGTSAEWVSTTPFIATRHPKERGRKRDRPEFLGPANTPAFLEHLLREELDRRAQRHPESTGAFPVAVEPWSGNPSGRRLPRPHEFRRQRFKPGDDGGRRPCGFFRVRLSQPIAGPLCLGYSSHFGLGMFLPLETGTS